MYLVFQISIHFYIPNLTKIHSANNKVKLEWYKNYDEANAGVSAALKQYYFQLQLCSEGSILGTVCNTFKITN